MDEEQRNDSNMLKDGIVAIQNMFEWIEDSLEAIESKQIEVEDIKTKQTVLERRLDKFESAKVKEETYLFCWDNVHINDNDKRLRSFLRDDLDLDWANDARIYIFDVGKTIRIFKDEHSVEIIINEKKEKATLKISDGRTYDLKVKKENGKLNIYSEFITHKESEEVKNLATIPLEKSVIDELKGKIEKIVELELSDIPDENMLVEGVALKVVINKMKEMGLIDIPEEKLETVRLIMNIASLSLDKDYPVDDLDDEDILLIDFLVRLKNKMKDKVDRDIMKIPMLYNKGVELLKKGTFKSACECFDKITETNPYLKGAWFNRGFALGKLGDIEGELESYEEALKIDKKYKKALREKNKRKRYLFNWDNVSESYSKRFLRFLRDELNLGWSDNAKILKSDDDKSIRIFNDENSANIIINYTKRKATLKISDDITYDLKIKKENDKLNIYKKRELWRSILNKIPLR
jgi:tetratricopeptide (TPR) repeat protein